MYNWLRGTITTATTKSVYGSKDFEAYYKAGGVQKASALAQNRYQAEIDHNVPLEDIACYEVGGSIAVLVNTAPASFWTLLLLHSDPSVLDGIWKEIDARTKTTIKKGSTLNDINSEGELSLSTILLSRSSSILLDGDFCLRSDGGYVTQPMAVKERRHAANSKPYNPSGC
ncbi:hypothetical protein F4805DRAFT_421704 [Annulohypoxylon moriforme]|nr:hypothetical protein F4805DRAFT_421704 [Annulohypoxylon moriforme]